MEKKNNLTDEEVLGKMYRADGRCICKDCGLEYYKHPFTNHRDSNDYPWLNILCNGDFVKL